VETSALEVQVITAGFASDSFAGAVVGELESAGENTLSVQEQDATGMEVLFSLKAQTSGDVEESIVSRDTFAAEFAAEAMANNIIGTMAYVESDASRITIITLAPTVSPTQMPTAEVPGASESSSGLPFDLIYLVIGGGGLMLAAGGVAAWKRRTHKRATSQNMKASGRETSASEIEIGGVGGGDNYSITEVPTWHKAVVEQSSLDPGMDGEVAAFI